MQFGFLCSTAGPSLFVYRNGTATIVFLLYVDDIILMGNDTSLLNKFACHLGHSFNIKDMGRLQFFLGMKCSILTMVYF